MRVPRLQVTMRRVMAAVAILGLMLGSETARRRWVYNRSMASYHDEQERRMRLLLAGGWITETDQLGTRTKLRIGRNIEREPVEQRLLYHLLMKERFRWAARRPWLAVAPDAMEPE